MSYVDDAPTKLAGRAAVMQVLVGGGVTGFAGLLVSDHQDYPFSPLLLGCSKGASKPRDRPIIIIIIQGDREEARLFGRKTMGSG